MGGLPLKQGDVVDDYYVERIAGVGGMAIVGVATHQQRGHRVALKLLLPENARYREVVQRFEREQRTLMQLHSEHTLRIYGAGAFQGTPYMVLEYLEGYDLEELLKREGPMPIERAVELILQACHSISEAHAHGIVHRDLKPANLFLVRRHDGSPCVKVLDFGISTAADDSTAAEPTLTKTSAIMGSPFYMAPEQMLSAKDVDARTDIWAMGVCLYELLTKSIPFAAETPMKVCHRVLHDEPTALRKLRPMYPKGLDEIIGRCLQRRPANRFQNIADFATCLADFGPKHSRHAIEKIYQLVEPSLPSEQEHLIDEEDAEVDNVGTTTIYLAGDEPKRGVGLGLLAAASCLCFGLGGAVGWVSGLPTDPTVQSNFQATNPAANAPKAKGERKNSAAKKPSTKRPAARKAQRAPETSTLESTNTIDLDAPGDLKTKPAPQAAPARPAAARPKAKPLPKKKPLAPSPQPPKPAPPPAPPPPPANNEVEF